MFFKKFNHILIYFGDLRGVDWWIYRVKAKDVVSYRSFILVIFLLLLWTQTLSPMTKCKKKIQAPNFGTTQKNFHFILHFRELTLKRFKELCSFNENYRNFILLSNFNSIVLFHYNPNFQSFGFPNSWANLQSVVMEETSRDIICPNVFVFPSVDLFPVLKTKRLSDTRLLNKLIFVAL